MHESKAEREDQSAAGYDNYQQWIAGTNLDRKVSLEDYSVTNRGLASGLVGTPAQVQERVAEFADAGADLLLLQCSPQLEEMERFAESVIRSQKSSANGAAQIGMSNAPIGAVKSTI